MHYLVWLLIASSFSFAEPIRRGNQLAAFGLSSPNLGFTRAKLSRRQSGYTLCSDGCSDTEKCCGDVCIPATEDCCDNTPGASVWCTSGQCIPCPAGQTCYAYDIDTGGYDVTNFDCCQTDVCTFLVSSGSAVATLVSSIGPSLASSIGPFTNSSTPVGPTIPPTSPPNSPTTSPPAAPPTSPTTSPPAAPPTSPTTSPPAAPPTSPTTSPPVAPTSPTTSPPAAPPTSPPPSSPVAPPSSPPASSPVAPLSSPPASSPVPPSTSLAASTAPSGASAVIPPSSSTTSSAFTSVCSPITGPTGTVSASNLPADYTWGCPPGFLCEPKSEVNCGVVAAPPNRNYVCQPSECVPATPVVPQFWGVPIYSDDVETYTLQDHYFNLDPQNFGLNFSIFVDGDGDSDGDTSDKRRAVTAPPACYDDCNACMLEAESTGKTPALCEPDSAFSAALSDCNECIQYHAGSKSEAFVDQAQPDFQQFLDYCSGTGASPVISNLPGAQSEVAGSPSNVVPAAPAQTAATAALPAAGANLPVGAFQPSASAPGSGGGSGGGNGGSASTVTTSAVGVAGGASGAPAGVSATGSAGATVSTSGASASVASGGGGGGAGGGSGSATLVSPAATTGIQPFTGVANRVQKGLFATFALLFFSVALFL